jgi:RNA polymerase sigma-70 factor
MVGMITVYCRSDGGEMFDSPAGSRSQLFGAAFYQYNGRTLIDSHSRPMTTSSEADFRNNLAACSAQLDAIYAHCAEVNSDFGLSPAEFREAVIRAVDKYLVGFGAGRRTPSTREIRKFIAELQHPDLYLALACARGNEHAWWEFDRQHRTFIERWARHLVRGATEADEVIDSVYVELFGTKMVAGERQSKFRTYTGRGTLRGWLRTVILHAVIDLYRARKAEVPLEDWLATTDENDRQAWPTATRSAEESLLTSVARERYRSATIAALDHSLATLDDHEKLLLLYYHVEGLKLREIARIVEEPMSPIRRWFSRRRVGAAPGRVHESTVMRWLERVYRKVANRFHSELANKHGLNAAEIEICKVIATEDPAQGLKLERSTVPNEGPPKTADAKVRVEGA